VRIAIAPTSLDLLSGAILDFDRPENESDPQFIFLNPNDPHFSPPDTTSAND
jgi:Fe-S cluster assembly iron-binding protein IscA